jgi:hypothetical protein
MSRTAWIVRFSVLLKQVQTVLPTPHNSFRPDPAQEYGQLVNKFVRTLNLTETILKISFENYAIIFGREVGNMN